MTTTTATGIAFQREQNRVRAIEDFKKMWPKLWHGGNGAVTDEELILRDAMARLAVHLNRHIVTDPTRAKLVAKTLAALGRLEKDFRCK